MRERVTVVTVSVCRPIRGARVNKLRSNATKRPIRGRELIKVRDLFKKIRYVQTGLVQKPGTTVHPNSCCMYIVHACKALNNKNHWTAFLLCMGTIVPQQNKRLYAFHSYGIFFC